MANKHFRRMWLSVLLLALTGYLSLKAAPNKVVRILQTNSAGDNVQIIDPVTNKVVGEITGIEVVRNPAVIESSAPTVISLQPKNYVLPVTRAKTMPTVRGNSRIANRVFSRNHPISHAGN